MWTALPAALTTHLLQPKQALPKPRPRRHRQAVPAPCCACTTANWCHRFATPPHAASSARCWPAEAKSVFAISTRVCRRGIGRSALLQILAIARLLLRFAPSSPSRSASCTPSREIVNTLSGRTPGRHPGAPVHGELALLGVARPGHAELPAVRGERRR